MTCVILRLDSKTKLSETQLLGFWQALVLCGQWAEGLSYLPVVDYWPPSVLVQSGCLHGQLAS